MNRRNALKTALAATLGIITNPLKFAEPVTHISGHQGTLIWRAGWGKLVIGGSSETVFSGNVELDGEVEIIGDVYFEQNLTINGGTTTLIRDLDTDTFSC